jgi:hypothetical protein
MCLTWSEYRRAEEKGQQNQGGPDHVRPFQELWLLSEMGSHLRVLGRKVKGNNLLFQKY